MAPGSTSQCLQLGEWRVRCASAALVFANAAFHISCQSCQVALSLVPGDWDSPSAHTTNWTAAYCRLLSDSLRSHLNNKHFFWFSVATQGVTIARRWSRSFHLVRVAFVTRACLIWIVLCTSSSSSSLVLPDARLVVSNGGSAFSRRVVRTRSDGSQLERTRVFRRTWLARAFIWPRSLQRTREYCRSRFARSHQGAKRQKIWVDCVSEYVESTEEEDNTVWKGTVSLILKLSCYTVCSNPFLMRERIFVGIF